MVDSTEGKRIISLMADQMLYPSVLFCFNKRESSSFNRSCVVDRLEGHVTIDVFRDGLIKNVELKENLTKSNKNLSAHAILIQQQKEEIEQLERMENEKKIRENKEKLRLQKELEEKRRLEEEKEMKKLEKKNLLTSEPDESNPLATFIIFRYPDGDRRAERRFLKTDKIQVKYIRH